VDTIAADGTAESAVESAVPQRRRLTPARRDGLVLAVILTLAAVLRLVGLSRRGEWNDDQGAEMLVLLDWVRDGHVPLLGPLSSTLTTHHGVAFYWVLAPGAFLTDANPTAAAATIALLGVAGVAATWWLGRTVGGTLAGHVAGLLMAVSPSAIFASTFVWNANIVEPGAALAMAAGWHAWRTRRARWWMLSSVGIVFAFHGHLLAALMAPALAALVIADVVRRPRSEWLRTGWPLAGAIAIVMASYLPLVIHEFGAGFPELHGMQSYLDETSNDDGPPVVDRLPMVAWRVLAWPVSGLSPTAPGFGFPAAILTAAALLAGIINRAGIARQFGVWAAGTTVWAIVALSILSPTLLVIYEGLPNDHYHAWLDPMLFAVIGVAAGRFAAARRRLFGRFAVGPIAAATVVAVCVGLSVASLPSTSSPDGGWPLANATAAKIRELTDNRPTAVAGVLKLGSSLAFPLRRQGAVITVPSRADFLVVVCDPLFERMAGLPCDGWAEWAVARGVQFPAARFIERFRDSSRRIVCVFSRT
jgi:4-amino-4-deoxy-L-arabinose transferase-like glycosyltransferase